MAVYTRLQAFVAVVLVYAALKGVEAPVHLVKSPVQGIQLIQDTLVRFLGALEFNSAFWSNFFLTHGLIYAIIRVWSDACWAGHGGEKGRRALFIGGVAEWSIASDFKSDKPQQASWVRIPPPPNPTGISDYFSLDFLLP